MKKLLIMLALSGMLVGCSTGPDLANDCKIKRKKGLNAYNTLYTCEYSNRMSTIGWGSDIEFTAPDSLAGIGDIVKFGQSTYSVEKFNGDNK